MDNSEGLPAKLVLQNGNASVGELQIQIDDDESISDTSVTQLTSSDCNSFLNAQTRQCNTTSLTSSDTTSQTSETESDSQMGQGKNLVAGSSGSSDSNVSNSSCSQCDENGEKNSKSRDNSPEIDSEKWYLHPRFKFYWQHYRHAMAWCNKHNSVTKQLRHKHSRNYTYPYYHHGYPMSIYGNPVGINYHQNIGHGHGYYSEYTNVGAVGRGRGRSRVNGVNINGHLSSSGTTEGSYTSKDDSTDTGDSEQFEMEVTDEMLQFFAHSAKHRKERDEKKLGADGKEEEHIDVDLIKVNKKVPTSEAPKERPGSSRTAEMLTLYGKGAAMIHGMETALQMTFDRNLDIKQPKIWPNMPLKLVFS